MNPNRDDRANKLSADEPQNMSWRNAAEGVGEASSNGYSRVSKRGGRREPIGTGDVKANRCGYGIGFVTNAAEDGDDQAKGGQTL